MHIDQRLEPGPPDSGNSERCGRKGAPVISSDTQTTFPSIRVASAWADPAGRHGKRPVICIETGEAFPNAAAASEHAGCSRQTIGNCAAGRSRTAGGYHWAYAEQPPKSWRAAIECPEAGAKFECLGDAAEWAGCEAAEIADCLAGKKDEAGGVRRSSASRPETSSRVSGRPKSGRAAAMGRSAPSYPAEARPQTDTGGHMLSNASRAGRPR